MEKTLELLRQAVHRDVAVLPAEKEIVLDALDGMINAHLDLLPRFA